MENGQRGDKRPKARDSFARNMAKAEFRRFYWNDDLEREKAAALKGAAERIARERREKRNAKN